MISGRCRQWQTTKSTHTLDYLFENIFLTIFMAVPQAIEKQIYPSRSLTNGLCRYLHVAEVRLLTYLSFPFFSFLLTDCYCLLPSSPSRMRRARRGEYSFLRRSLAPPSYGRSRRTRVERKSEKEKGGEQHYAHACTHTHTHSHRPIIPLRSHSLVTSTILFSLC